MPGQFGNAASPVRKGQTHSMVQGIDVIGYAIVSDDDKIAGPDGLVPPSLRNEMDWRYYQNAMDRADLVVFAHRSHDAEPNIRGHRRLVLSRSAGGLEWRANAWWWNVAQVDWEKVATQLLPAGGKVAIPGGQFAFDLFLDIGYDEFHMSRAGGVRVPGGRSIFAACDRGIPADLELSRGGLKISERLDLDPERGVVMHIWRRPC